MKNVRVSMVENPGPDETIVPLKLEDTTVVPGMIDLIFSRRGYKDVREGIDMTEGTPATPLGEVIARLDFKPTKELSVSYEDGREAVQDRRYRQALAALQMAEALDPGYQAGDEASTVAELIATAEEGLVRTSKADNYERRAQEALAEGDWKAVEAAATGIDRLLGTKHARAEALRRSMKSGVETEEALLESIAGGEGEAAAGYLSRLRILSPRNPRVTGYLQQIEWVRRESEAVPAFLAELSRVYVLNDPAACLPLIHDSSVTLMDALKKEIVDLALRFGVVTPFTSFLVQEDSASALSMNLRRRIGGDLRLRQEAEDAGEGFRGGVGGKAFRYSQDLGELRKRALAGAPPATVAAARDGETEKKLGIIRGAGRAFH